MAGRGLENEKKYIYYAFPEDYSQLNSLLTVEGNKIIIKEKFCVPFRTTTQGQEPLSNKIITKEKFCVQPEYDLPYKLLSMIYSKNERIDNINRLRKKANDYSNNSLFIHNHRNFQWNDYMFQLPGIYELFGIRRDFHVGVPKGDYDDFINKIFNSADCSADRIIQTPILFLILVNFNLVEGVHLSNDMIDIINKAIDAYNQRKKSNFFSKEQLEYCHKYLLRNSEYESYAVWRVNSIAAKTQEKVEEIVKDYLDNTRIESGLPSDKKGESISFPKYMRSIIIGIHDGYDCLEFISPLINRKTLWARRNILDIEGVTNDTAKIFSDYLWYMMYRSESKNIFERYLDEIEELSNQPNYQQELEVYLDEKLKGYYIFCLHILYVQLSENTKYKNLARDTFERAFSMYFFHIETKLLYEKFDVLRATVPKEQGNDLKLLKFVINRVSSGVIRAIYCSPGIHHRVNLARYIDQTEFSKDILKVLYPALNDEDINISTINEQVCNKISIINKEYFACEKKCIFNMLSEKNELLESDIVTKHKLIEENKKCEEYKGYYSNLQNQIEDEITYKSKFTRKDAIKIAENILGKKKCEEKLIYLWVILSSFSSEDIFVKPT